MQLRTWSESDIFSGIKVFLRIDANVPIEKGVVYDSGKWSRLSRAVPEIIKLKARGARIILATHLGQPGGVRDDKFSVKPLAAWFSKKIGESVTVLPGIVGSEVERAVMSLRPGGVVMLENLRFFPEEENNDLVFAANLAKLSDLYINNAFGVCHRSHASVLGITNFLPSFAGSLLCEEVLNLSLEPLYPSILMMGGAKLSTKISIIKRLGDRADKILLGGAICLPFLHAINRDLPDFTPDYLNGSDLECAEQILDLYRDKIILPDDFIFDYEKRRVLDIGPETIRIFKYELSKARQCLWNGPMGVIEDNRGQDGTLGMAECLANLKIPRAILGGGESVDFLERKSLLDGFSYVSTGGGAMLAFLSGEDLPALRVLRKN